jgi:CheY-like chemotaxis protein
MTINRCVDYTRVIASASSTACMDPSLTLQLPLRTNVFPLVSINKAIEDMISVMQTVNIATNVTIQSSYLLDKDDSTRCGNKALSIETDKEWLEDNILCLLSNAVKFAQSKVNIVVSFVDGEMPLSQEDCNVGDECKMPFENAGEIDLETGLKLINLSAKRIGGTRTDQHLTERMVRIEVKDDGPGIACSGEDESKGFDWDHIMPQQNRPTGGLGLGLYCVARRVSALGGKYGIGRNSGDGPGTAVWFTLPYRSHSNTTSGVNSPSSYKRRRTNSSLGLLVLSKEPSQYSSTSIGLSPAIALLNADSYFDDLIPTITCPSSPISSSTTSPIKPPVESKPMPPPCIKLSDSMSALSELKILIVDDSPTILKMTALLFSKLNVSNQVCTAKNGQDALNLVLPLSNENISIYPTFDVILMDLQMPVLDGYGAMSRIRQWEEENKCNNTLIVAMSANADPDTEEKALSAGADVFLTKPLDMQAFRSVLAEYRKG